MTTEQIAPSGSSRGESTIPVPLAFAGVGLIVALALPGGLSGGEGFLVGLIVGTLVVLLAESLEQRHAAATRARTTTHCPNCGVGLRVSVVDSTDTSDTPEPRSTASKHV